MEQFQRGQGWNSPASNSNSTDLELLIEVLLVLLQWSKVNLIILKFCKHNLLEVGLAEYVKNSSKMELIFSNHLDFDTVGHAQETFSAVQRQEREIGTCSPFWMMIPIIPATKTNFEN